MARGTKLKRAEEDTNNYCPLICHIRQTEYSPHACPKVSWLQLKCDTALTGANSHFYVE